MNSKLEIAIIYFSNEGREINFQELKHGGYSLSDEENNPEFFWGATGGLEITVDGYKTIFRGFEFYVAMKGVEFLLHSLFWLEGKLDGYDVDPTFPESVVSRFSNHNYIKLSRNEEGILSLSYQPSDAQLAHEKRNRFFKDEQFSPKDWSEAARIALKNYFDVLNPILLANMEHKCSRILENYLVKEWEKLQH